LEVFGIDDGLFLKFDMKTKLDDLIVLFLDCQATGANPENGAVIELGWARSCVHFDMDITAKRIETYLIQLPEDRVIPRRVQSITGISLDDLVCGHPIQKVWKKLYSLADDIARLNRMKKCPVIIHFSQYEKPFLHRLHQQFTPKRAFPFEIVCTHQISKRLFPNLPRKGIRAVAGFLGFSTGELRRCHDHVLATVFIWHEMLAVLKEKHNIVALGALQEWLSKPVNQEPMKRVYPMESALRSSLPDRPGVYRMLRLNGDVLYVGKATSLKQRVRSYFQVSTRHAEHILEMLSQATRIEFTETESTLEASVLESDEIKRLSPPYNKALRTRERKVWFCSSDLAEYSEIPRDSCRIGPFSSLEVMKRMSSIQQIVRANRREEIDEHLFLSGLDIPPDYAPDSSCIRDGFEIFLNRHNEIFKKESIECAMKRLGREIWIQRLKERAEKAEEKDSEDELEKQPFEWTAESVARTIEGHVTRWAHEIRRARWLVLLSESALAWEETRTSKGRHLIVLQGGCVIHRETIDDNDDIPIPPGHGKIFMERQASFDLLTLDRLRVLTTEIRKLVTENHWIKVRLGPTVELDRDKLIKLFRWI